MASGSLDKRYLAYSILEFLDREAKNENSTAERREWLDVAMRNIQTAFNVNLTNQELRSSQPLDQIHQEFMARNRGNRNSAGPDASVIIETGEVYVVPAVASEEGKRLAETHKNSGNEKMLAGNFWEALESYTIAINLDGRNAAYFCNRAATYLKLNNLRKAIRDCQIAVQLNPEYARAYDRMGVAYSAMTDHGRAYACYRKAAQLEPTNETYENNVLVTQGILALENANGGLSTNTGNATGTGLSLDPGAIANNIQALLNNADSYFITATQILSNPAVQNVAERLRQANEYWTRTVDELIPGPGDPNAPPPNQGNGGTR